MISAAATFRPSDDAWRQAGPERGDGTGQDRPPRHRPRNTPATTAAAPAGPPVPAPMLANSAAKDRIVVGFVSVSATIDA